MNLSGRAKGGDGDLEVWLADGYAAAYRTAFLILHNRHDAEEAVQDAFLRAWRFRAAVPDGEGVRPWLYRVVVNSCLSKLRSERNHRTRQATLEDDVAARPSSPLGAGLLASPEAAAEDRDLHDTVMTAIAALPEHLRIVVVLRYYAQLSEREIASVIHRRPGTVKSRLHEAKARLGEDSRLGGYHPLAVGVSDGSNDD